MAKSINDLLYEADEIISKHAQQKKPEIKEDDIFKLAEAITTQPPEQKEVQFNLTEKIAHAAAILDTLINLPQLVKIAEFEQKAKEAGYNDGQIAEFFEKKASVKLVSVLDLFPG